MREVISYSDITTVETVPAAEGVSSGPSHGASNQSSNSKPPPSKKRRGNNGPGKRQAVQHWDDPGTEDGEVMYDSEQKGKSNAQVLRGRTGVDDGETALMEDGEAEEEEESRYLTHEEIWDDSALISAWDAANEEYEALHGKGKKWKEDRQHQSPLWYNKPPTNTKTSIKDRNRSAVPQDRVSSAPAINGHSSQQHAGDSRPIDFNTFVPTHDPSLSSSAQALSFDHFEALQSGTQFPLPDLNITADEAFSKAVSATYWSGYWSAVYQYQRALEQRGPGSSTVPQGEYGDDNSSGADEEDAGEVSTQR